MRHRSQWERVERCRATVIVYRYTGVNGIGPGAVTTCEMVHIQCVKNQEHEQYHTAQLDGRAVDFS